MRVVTGRGPIPWPRRAVVTIGMFDGVHRAHQQLIRSTVQFAHRLKGTSVILTFDPDPQLVLEPAQVSPALMPLEERLRRFEALGVAWVWVIPFTKLFARMSAPVFIRRVLQQRLHAVAVVVGEAFAFGRHRHGDMAVLRAVGPAHGLRVVSVPSIRQGGAPISSSRIRRLIQQGQLAQARRLLGDDPALYGVVVRGVGRGRRLGFPTANIRIVSQVMPPCGVYAVHLRMADGRRSWRGVMNLGVRPTFGPGPLVCEVHLLGFTGTMQGRRVKVALLARLRSERCFDSPDALRRHIRLDLARARRMFARRHLP